MSTFNNEWRYTMRYTKRLAAEEFVCNFMRLRGGGSSPGIRTNELPVVHQGGITQVAGDAISFGFISISGIDRNLP
jgi:hypothetical protein